MAELTTECDSIKNRLQGDPDEEDSIPLADDDPSAVVDDVSYCCYLGSGAKFESLDSIPSMISDSLPLSAGPSSLIGLTASHVTEQMTRMCLDPDFSPDEAEEKARLISQVIFLVVGSIFDQLFLLLWKIRKPILTPKAD